MAIMAVAALSLVGCKDKNNPAEGGGNEQPQDTTVTPPAGDDVPEGYVRILIQVPDGEECHGIYMKGCVNGQWSGENTYVGLESGGVSADEAIRFKRIAENSDFFQADFKLGTDGLQGKVCQLYPKDASWQGQAVKVSLIEDKTTLENAVAWKEENKDWPQLIISAGTKPCVIALKIGGWQNSECVKANEAGKAIWTMRSKVALPEGTKVGISGVNIEGYANWDNSNPIIMEKQADGSYVAMCNVGANCVYKYTLCFPEEAGFDDKHGHIIAGDKSDLSMPVSLQPVDEVDEWLEFEKRYLPEDFVPADHQFGLIGSWDGWTADAYAFVYGEKDGDFYVAEATNVEFAAGTEFKVRENGSWDVPNKNFGWGIEILGDAANFEDASGNIKAIADATYAKVILKFKWNGASITEISLDFQK